MKNWLWSILKLTLLFFLIRWILEGILEDKVLGGVSMIIAFFLDGINDIRNYLRKINDELRENNGKLPEK